MQKIQRRAGFWAILLGIFLTGCSPDVLSGTERTEKLEVYFFSCSDDADSILLQTEDANVMIDTGLEDDSDALIEKMKMLGVKDLDLLILTHPDKDHIGGADKVLKTFPVEKVMQTGCEKGSVLQDRVNLLLREENVEIPKKIVKEEFGELEITVYPPKESVYKKSNNYSIGVLAQYEGVSFFFAADAEKKRLKEFLEEELPDVDVIKVAHHGRDSEGSDTIIEVLHPEYAVVTAGGAEENTERALEKENAKIYSTLGQDVRFETADGAILDGIWRK